MSPTVEIDKETHAQLRELTEQSKLPIPELLGEAVDTLHRSLVGDASPQLGIPFKKRWSDKDADIVLRQVSPKDFRLEEPFKFKHEGEEDVIVERGDVTDLASVPEFLTWLVPRYGRHTLPALLHDHLVVPDMNANLREQADTTFRDTMGAAKVPLVRRWMMWAAVSLATQWQQSWKTKVLVLAWLALYALAGFDLFFALIGRRPVPAVSSFAAIAVILVSPLALSLVWGSRYWFGLIVAYSVLVLPASLVAVGLTLALYVLVEGAAQVYLRIRRRRGAPVRINPVRLSKL